MRRAAVFKWWKCFRDGSRSQNRLFHYHPEACGRTFTRSGWNVVRSASVAKGGNSKKRPSPHLHKVPTWSIKASPRTFQTALVIDAMHMGRMVSV
jgi:hypothetical protein